MGSRDISQADSGPLAHSVLPSQPPTWFILVCGFIQTGLALLLWACHVGRGPHNLMEFRKEEDKGWDALLQPISSGRFHHFSTGWGQASGALGQARPKLLAFLSQLTRAHLHCTSKMHSADYKLPLSLNCSEFLEHPCPDSPLKT